jgi:peptidylprolyl isomerase
MKNILKNKAVAIFIIGVLVVAFTLFVMKMFDNIGGNMGTKIKLETNHGNIVIELYSDMPVTAGNFQKLVEDGTYDGVIFHRIIKGFMIQGGDPTGTGMGDPAIPNIADEFTHAGGNKNDRGTLSMANAGPNTGSSQFFINLVDNNFLDGKHPTFGKVVDEASMDVVDKIANVATGAGDRPVEEVKILKASVV